MKKITLALLLIAFGFGTSLHAQVLQDDNAKKDQIQSTNNKVVQNKGPISQDAVLKALELKGNSPTNLSNPERVSGTPILNDAAGTTTATKLPVGASVALTPNTSQTIAPGEEIACASATSFRDNNIFVDFDLDDDYSVNGDFRMAAVEVAIGPVSTPSGFPLTLNIWESDGAFPGGMLTMVNSMATTITNAEANSIISIPITGTISEGMNLVVEFVIVDDGTDTNFMRFGCNSDGSITESWIVAPDCGATTPATLASLGLPQDFVVNAIGQQSSTTICGAGNPQAIPVTGSGGFPCVGGPTESDAAITDVGTLGTNPGEYTLDQVEIDLTHTWDADLEISLVSPAGTSLDLSSDNGGSGDNYTGTVFQDGGADITAASAPFTGVFAPEGGTFAATFAGEAIDGNWTLSICDDAGGDTGTLNSYCISFSRNPVVPIISCPADVMADTDPTQCGAVVNFADAIAIDPDGGPVTVMQTMGPVSGSVFPVGDTIVQFTATDDQGDMSMCQFTITVTDNEAPIAMCQDITLEVDPGTGMVSIVPADVDNGSTDNCGIVDYSIDIDTFTCADVGPNTVTLTVTDAEGNSSSCTATVTIEDNTAPVIACIGQPADVTDSASSSPAAAIPDDDPVGLTDTITITDDQTIIDLDVDLDIAHTWVGDLAITIESPAGTQVTIVDQPGVPATGFGCSGDDILATLDDEATDPVEDECDAGVPTISGSFIPNEALSAFDGESSLGDWTITVVDNAGGDTGTLNGWTINYTYENSGAPLDVVLDANGMATVNIADLLLSVDEACGWTATAGSMSTNSLETTFAGGNGQSGNMFDIMAVNDLTVQSFDVSMDAGVTDDVEIYFKTGTWVGFDTDPSAWTLVETVTGVTSAGTNVPTPLNTNLDIDVAAGETVAFYVTLVNTTNIAYTDGTTTGALFASDANLEFYEGAGKAYPFDLTFDPRIFNGNIIYDVDGVSTTMDFTCADLGENQVDITVTDDSGNTAMCTATVNILDETAPIITCGPPADVSDGASTSPGQTIDTTGSDVTISSVLSVTDDQALNDLNVDLNINHTWIADLEITLTSPAGTSVVIFSGGADGCGSSDLVATLDDESANPLDCQAGDAFPLADYIPSNALSAFDGESTLGDWTLSITDTFPGLDGGTLNSWGITYSYPNPNPNSVIELDENGMAVVDPFDLISSVDEACGISTAAVDINEVFCSDIGTTLEITVFVSDASGNIASCVAMVDVVDVMAPELTCPADQTVDPGAGNLNYEVPDYFAEGEATATDNCTDPVTITTQDPAPGTLLPDGDYTVTLTAEDEYGNVATCTFELTVESTFGVEDVLANAVSIYPNPARNVINITNGSAIGLDNATIYDVNGRLVQTIDLTNMTTEKTVDVSQLASGVYMVNIQGEGGNTIKRLIKE